MRQIRSLRPAVAACIAVAACFVAAESSAQFKVIGRDGSVTYTDREPTLDAGRVVPLGKSVVEASAPELPYELRQVASRFPVTLYTTLNGCEPCVAGRAMLRQRGIPYVERQVTSNADGDALEKITGGREAPTLTIGSQTLRGYSSESWSSYLDAAGYPRESKLPGSWAWSAATPVVDKREVGSGAATRAVAAPAQPAQPTATPAGAGGIRF